ncbi:hypothetical protein ACLB0R_11035 [Sphingomonas sp. GlSt437]|uniref:hypothetical protein n=1 Tax=Sphingomonas sp. GlSt437 TaxID=3389970 RepID=UPI003A8970E6
MIARSAALVAMVAAAGVLDGCGRGTDATGASYSEARQLDDSAKSLDAAQGNAVAANASSDEAADANADQGDTAQ